MNRSILTFLMTAALAGCNGSGGGYSGSGATATGATSTGVRGSTGAGTTGTGSSGSNGSGGPNSGTGTGTGTGASSGTGTGTSSGTGTGTSSGTGTGTGTGTGPTSAYGEVFPANNPWNTDISGYPVHPNSDNFINSIGASTGLHPDFGTTYNGAPNGIPFVVVSGTQPLVPINFVAYASESDPGPYPVPANAPIEGGPNATGDRHVIVVDKDHHMLYEMDNAFPDPTTGGWTADCGAVFDLQSNNLRPAGWTSADAAGLPIFAGLVRYDEAVTQGAINHALRFTVAHSQHGYVLPAEHYASSSTDPNLPPMGLRLRLKASVNISVFPPEVQVILTALKKYGMFVADNGSNWYISGAPDSNWNDSNLATLSQIKGSDFEVVDTGPIVTQ